jgi:hypothetical protein
VSDTGGGPLATPKAHVCERCTKTATHCYREGSGTGHSEHVCACEDHTEDALDSLAAALMRIGRRQ